MYHRDCERVSSAWLNEEDQDGGQLQPLHARTAVRTLTLSNTPTRALSNPNASPATTRFRIVHRD